MSSLDSSSSKPQRTFYFDVFLTFRTKNPEISSLLTCLRNASIDTFIDNNNKAMTSFIFETIQRSRILVVVFTKDFGDSRICLEKLEKMMACHDIDKRVVLPLFCGVDMTEVQEQSGRFKQGFKRLKRKTNMTTSEESNWRRVLAEAAWLSINWKLPILRLRNSKKTGEFIDLIKKELDNHYALSPSRLVGLQLRVEDVLRLAKFSSRKTVNIEDQVIIVGIWGAGGIGKTTVTRVIYDIIGDSFERKSFLSNIKDTWGNDNGQVLLQEKLISDISDTEPEKIDDVEMGIRHMERVLGSERALVVLDDVSRRDQLQALCGSSEWFGAGSLIIITTRNKHLLDELKVKCAYEMKKLDYSESGQLFSWHAFKKFGPINDFIDLSMEAISHCEGLPLVLEVLGSLLHNRTMPEWENVVKKLKGIPSSQIQVKLNISCHFLNDWEKDLFFNIACFYVGKDKKYVMDMLKGSKFPVEMGIQTLVERSLVNVDTNDKVDVHDLLQEIGRGINSNKPKPQYKYNVFLSFRGEDTRKTFTTHLYNALKKAGIKVFMDDQIKRGEDISSSLLQTIESSRISIIIFSKNYAGSSWCLQELEKIMECHRTTGQEVLPIFYNVRPSEVRKQLNTFGEALAGLIKITSASKEKKLTISWKRALYEAANLSGWDMHNYGTEAELINHVLETIITKLDDNTYLFVAHHPVGVVPRVQDIIQLLSSKSNEVIIAGIRGMGGIGKTTLAKAIYNEIGQIFEGKCFLTNIREVWEHNNGQVYLQEQLLSGILKSNVTLPNVELGKTRMKESLCHKRVLVVLDDIDKVDQLNALCGSREWFGRGSRIIITTRDKHLLKIHEKVHEYSVKEMDNSESRELFSWHAFKQAIPEGDFFELSTRVVSYSGGLPLALEVLGSYLCDKEINNWESVLEKLQKIQNDTINEKLKISFDGLSDNTEKEIFLDICCFFIGKDRNYVTEILNGCGLYADIGITRLIELSLVRVDKKNKLDMHDLLRNMGRQIICETSLEEPEKRTRLWLHDDVLKVLRNNTGTITIKGLALNLSRSPTLSFSAKAFKKMKNLRLLQLDHVRLIGDYEYLSKELRWLRWHGFPSENMPMNLTPENIVAIDLRFSNLTQVWKNNQLLKRLKFLNLSHSHYLTQTPDFSKIPNLEKLILKDCPYLSMVHPTIGDLEYITSINLKDCKGLSHLPRTIYNLTSLKTLNLSGCSKIDKLEEDIVQMGSLTTLMENQTAITQVPFSLVRSSINYVSLCGYEGESRDVFPTLIRSWMSPTNTPKSLIQGFRIMPYLLQGLSHRLFAKSNLKLETRPGTSQVSRRKAPASNDFLKQVHMVGSENFLSSLTIQVGGFNKVTDTLLKSISQVWSNGGYDGSSLPEDNYPDWLNFKGEGSSVLFEVPQVIGSRLKGLVLYIVYLSPQDSMASVYPVSVLISNHTKATIEFYKRDGATTSNDEEWHNIISNLEPGNEVKVIVTFACKFIVKKTLIYLVYDKDVGKRIMY